MGIYIVGAKSKFEKKKKRKKSYLATFNDFFSCKIGLKIAKISVPIRPINAIISMIYHYASTAMLFIPKSMLCWKGNVLTMTYLATMADNIKMEIIAIYLLLYYNMYIVKQYI